MIISSFLKNKRIISWDIRLFKIKLLILPKMTIVQKGAFGSFLKITTSLAGKGYLHPKCGLHLARKIVLFINAMRFT